MMVKQLNTGEPIKFAGDICCSNDLAFSSYTFDTLFFLPQLNLKPLYEYLYCQVMAYPETIIYLMVF